MRYFKIYAYLKLWFCSGNGIRNYHGGGFVIMMCRRFDSQKGFSLIRFILLLVILGAAALIVLSFLPRVGGGTFDVINQISSKAKNVVSGITSRIAALPSKLEPLAEKIEFLIAEIKDRWYWYQHKDDPEVQSRSMQWDQDMDLLIKLAEEQGYDMGPVREMRNRYSEGTASTRRVEQVFWYEIQRQTVDTINDNIRRFRQRPLGCSDFTEELKKIWEIEEKFNQETLEGYFEAKLISKELGDVRSLEYTQDLFGWMQYPNTDWFMQQLADALPVGSHTPDYPVIIEAIDARMRSSNNPFEWALGNACIAEIYLNYNLINPAETRFDEAIRHLSTILGHYGNRMTPEQLVGLRMALGLLNERVCKNNDLAAKEFKDVIAHARRSGFACEIYNDAHYHLGIINLRLLEVAQVGPAFKEQPASGGGVSPGDPKPETTPTPLPTPTPTPTPTPNPIKIEITIPRSRTLREDVREDVKTRGGMQVIKGNVAVQRALRMKPSDDDTQVIEDFNVGRVYDLSNIPDGAIREFEFYLQCTNVGARADIAREIHKQYQGQ